MSGHLVRAMYRSVRVPGLSAPNDTAHLKIHYPACAPQSDDDRNSGNLPAWPEGPAFPIIILLPGINVGHEGLAWLAHRLTAQGLIVVSYSLIGEEFPGLISATPGLDIAALGPEDFGTRPSALAIAPILAELAACNESGLLVGRIDLSRVILGGHSAGGTAALLNANPAWFAGVRGAFAYAAHTAAASLLGHPPGTMNGICADVPCLIMGGQNDGVIAASAARYGDPPGDATGRVIATFDQAITRDQGDCLLAIIKGANHFSIIDPKDDSTGRAFLDQPETLQDPTGLLGDMISAFVAEVLGRDDVQDAWGKVMTRQGNFEVLRRR
jgi:dienelactone hydrolase